jgi:hypothetical protein
MLSRDRLLPSATDYVGGHDPSTDLISPIFADLSGLPPLVISACTVVPAPWAVGSLRWSSQQSGSRRGRRRDATAWGRGCC